MEGAWPMPGPLKERWIVLRMSKSAQQDETAGVVQSELANYGYLKLKGGIPGGGHSLTSVSVDLASLEIYSTPFVWVMQPGEAGAGASWA